MSGHARQASALSGSDRSLLKRATGDRSMLTGSNLLGQVLNFVGGLLVARILGPVGRGNTSLVAVYNETSSTAMSLGVHAAVGHYAGAAPDAERERTEGELLGAAIRLSLFIVPVAAAVAWVITRVALDGVPRPIKVLVALAIVGTPIFNSVPNAARMILVARGQLRRIAALVVGQAVVRLAVFVALVVLDEFTATSVGIVLLGATWMTSVVTWLLVGVRPRRGGSARRLLRYGIQTVPGSLATLTNSRLDQLLIVPLLSTADLGIYAVAVGVAFVPANVGGTLALSIFREAARDTADRMATMRRVGQAVRWISLTGAVSLAAAAVLIVPVYGGEFSGSVVPACILIIGSCFTGLASVLAQVGHAVGRPINGSWSSLAALGVTAVGLPVALPLFGIVGAAVVSAAAYSANAIVMYRRGRRDGYLHDIVAAARGRLGAAGSSPEA